MTPEMRRPYRVDEPTPDSGVAMGEGPSVLDASSRFVCEAADTETAHAIVAALNNEPTREELLDALAAVVGMHTFAYLDKGIGTNTRDGKALLNARALLQRAGRITEGGKRP